MCEADRTGARVRLRPEARLAAAEHLRARLQVRVDLQADDGLPAHLSRSGTVSKPVACSSAWPTRKSRFSENCGPISCSPTGSPSDNPHGIDSPGRPAMLGGIASRSERYMASGFAVLAPSGNA